MYKMAHQKIVFRVHWEIDKRLCNTDFGISE